MNFVAVGKSGWFDGRMYARGSRSAGWCSAAQSAVVVAAAAAAAPAASACRACSLSTARHPASCAWTAAIPMRRGVHVSVLPRSIEFLPIT